MLGNSRLPPSPRPQHDENSPPRSAALWASGGSGAGIPGRCRAACRARGERGRQIHRARGHRRRAIRLRSPHRLRFPPRRAATPHRFFSRCSGWHDGRIRAPQGARQHADRPVQPADSRGHAAPLPRRRRARFVRTRFRPRRRPTAGRRRSVIAQRRGGGGKPAGRRRPSQPARGAGKPGQRSQVARGGREGPTSAVGGYQELARGAEGKCRARCRP